MKFLTLVLMFVLMAFGGRMMYNNKVAEEYTIDRLWNNRVVHSQKMEVVDPKQMMFEQEVARRMHEKAFSPSNMNVLLFNDAYIAQLQTDAGQTQLERAVLDDMAAESRSGATGAYTENELKERIDTMQDKNIKSVTAQSIAVAKEVLTDVVKGAKDILKEVASAAQ